MKTLRRSDLAAIAMIATMVLLGIATWPVAPDRMPVHWNWSGEPDRLGGRVEGLFLAPLAAALIYVVFLIVPRLDPRRAHYDAFADAYAAMRTLVVGIVCAMQVMLILWVRGLNVDVVRFGCVAVGAALIGLGNYMPKIKSNWFIGVRTPWTLSSEESWRRTHRLAGWLFVASGSVTIAATLLGPRAAFATLLISLGAAAATSVVFSYFAWRADLSRGDGGSVGGSVRL